MVALPPCAGTVQKGAAEGAGAYCTEMWKPRFSLLVFLTVLTVRHFSS